MEVNIHEAKTHLSRLLARVAMGEEVIIAKAGTPVAKLVAVKPAARRLKLGSAKGEFVSPTTSTTHFPRSLKISSGKESPTRYSHFSLGRD
jgi:prevent-host-death family protein